jgi:hypothetical protein
MWSNLQSEINQIENIAITHDMWTSANTESYDTTTCHYITDTWVMKEVVLETKKMDGHHSSENISHELESTRKAWMDKASRTARFRLYPIHDTHSQFKI